MVLLLNTTIFNTAAILLQYYLNITSILHSVFQYYRNTTSIQHYCHFNTPNTHFNTTRVPIQLNTTNTTQYYTQAQYYIKPILPNTTNTTNTTRGNLEMEADSDEWTRKDWWASRISMRCGRCTVMVEARIDPGKGVLPTTAANVQGAA